MVISLLIQKPNQNTIALFYRKKIRERRLFAFVSPAAAKHIILVAVKKLLKLLLSLAIIMDKRGRIFCRFCFCTIPKSIYLSVVAVLMLWYSPRVKVGGLHYIFKKLSLYYYDSAIIRNKYMVKYIRRRRSSEKDHDDTLLHFI